MAHIRELLNTFQQLMPLFAQLAEREEQAEAEDKERCDGHRAEFEAERDAERARELALHEALLRVAGDISSIARDISSIKHAVVNGELALERLALANERVTASLLRDRAKELADAYASGVQAGEPQEGIGRIGHHTPLAYQASRAV